MTSNGEILTNNHVVNGATSVSVTDIGNGKTYKATVVGYDECHDVAVLQLSGASGLTTATTGDSSTVKVGDNVVGARQRGRRGRHPVRGAGHGHRAQPVDHRLRRGLRIVGAAQRPDRDATPTSSPATRAARW